jgi:hypothetical protein
MKPSFASAGNHISLVIGEIFPLTEGLLMGDPNISEMEQKQIEIFRGMSPEERLKMAIQLCHMSRNLLAEGVRKRHPEYNEQQIKFAVFKLLLPDPLFQSAYPEAKEILP